jgi:hypothetical protein
VVDSTIKLTEKTAMAFPLAAGLLLVCKLGSAAEELIAKLIVRSMCKELQEGVEQ